MAKCKTIGIDDYIEGITKISTQIDPIAGKVIYEGAKVLADAIRTEINAIPNKSGSPPFTGLLESQKKGLQDGLGIANAETKDGFRNVKIGFNGYNELKTKKYPNGEPNALIARSLAKGTSWQKRNNFVQKACNKAKSKVESTMKDTFDKEFAKYNK